MKEKWERIKEYFLHLIEVVSGGVKRIWRKKETYYETVSRAFAFVFIVAIPVLLYLFICNYEYLSGFFTDKNERGELFKVALTVVGGIGALIAIYYSAKRVTAMEKGNVDTRFNNAVGHLGHNNPTVVLGGIHALHQIAVENKNYRQIVHNLFCSFLRENSAKLYEETEKSNLLIQCPVIVQILIDYLFKTYNGEKSIYWKFYSDLSGSTLKNCNFEDATLINCGFGYATLTRCEFGKATLTGCGFDNATLTGCGFGKATLTGCGFGGATLNGCGFGYATLTYCGFGYATLTYCGFGYATLTYCGFGYATLTRCEFGKATLNGCGFGKATLTDCGFGYATLTDCGFGYATLTGCEFGYATLTGCRFRDAILTACGFDEATLHDCGFDGATLNGCRFGGATLTGCTPEDINTPTK